MATKSQRAKRAKRRSFFLQAAAAIDGPLRLECEVPVVFQAAKGGEGEDALPTFEMTLYTGGKMKPRGFTIPVIMDLSRTTVAAGARPILFNHDATRPVGHGEITVEKSSIKASGVISLVNADAENVRVSSKNGFPWKSSIGADVGRLEFVEAGKVVEVNGRKHNGPVYVARDNVCYEGSFVTLAGDNRSSATVAATLGDSAMNFETWLKAKGFDLTTLTDVMRATLQAAFDAEMNPPKPPATEPPPKPITANKGPTHDEEEEDPVLAMRAAHAAEINRVNGIKKIFASGAYSAVTIKTSAGETDLLAHAVAEGWTPEATELYALRASRPTAAGPAVHVADNSTNLQALQGAMMLRAGVKLDSPIFGDVGALALGLPGWIRAGLNSDQRQKAMESAWKFRDMSMVDVARACVRLDGKDITADRDTILQAAFSGTNLSAVFTTNVNAVLLSAYMEGGDTTVGWVREEDVNNFNLQERPRVTTGQGLEKLLPGGTATHVKDSDVMEQFKIARYARQFVVDDQDMIGDRFGIFKDKPEAFGKAARRLRPDLVYYILMSNPTMGADSKALFHVDHGNLNTSAALAAPTLKAAIADFEIQSENGVTLDLKMAHLIVPSELKHTGKELISSSETYPLPDAAGTGGVRGNRNTLQDENLTLVSEGRLQNGVTDPDTGVSVAGSSTTWFGASTMAHTIIVGYLSGTGRVPQVRSFTLDRGQWGMGWDIKHDIGAKGLDFRGLQKNTAGG